MKQKFTIFFLLLTITCSIGFTQQVSFIKYTVQDGLVANPVRCVYQDSKGFIWIGTFDGLSRYDGYKFTNYTTINGLSHNFINSILEVNGKLLIAENNGSIDIIQNNSIREGPRVGSAVNFVNVAGDRIIFTTDADGFFEYRDETVIPVSKIDNISTLGHFIKIGDSLFLTDAVDKNLFLLNNDFNILASLPNPAIHYYSLLQDSKKRIWACTSRGLLLVQFSTDTKPQLSFGPLPSEFDIPPLRNGWVTSMLEEADGSFWMGTIKGLVHLFPDGSYHLYNEKDGLPSAQINSLYLDKEKNLWIGTSLGLAKWVSRNNVIFFNTESGNYRNDVNSMHVLPDGQILLNTYIGMQYFDFASKQFIDIKTTSGKYPIPINNTSPLLFHFGNHLGMLDYEKRMLKPVATIDTTLGGIISGIRHPQGPFILGAFGGVFIINKTTVKKIIPYRTTGIAIDKNGHIWFGTWMDGLFRIILKNPSAGQYDVVDMTEIIKEKAIRTVFADRKGNIWVGTRYGGVFNITPKGNDNFDLLHFNRQSGLMSDWIISFAETKTNDIWVGTYLGLDKLVKESSGYRVFNFSKTINFFAEIKKIVFAQDHWFCVANSGIAVFKDEDLHKIQPLQPVILSATLGVGENKITLFSPNERISLKPVQNAARFEFGALGFINERQILYSYRLKGRNDTSWSKPENIHEATYASLSPGEYTFEVKTIGWNGLDGIPASFSFNINTPFWKQWWFIGLVVVFVIGLLYAFYRYRINQLLRLQTVRNNIATDLHDDIGSSLTNISILSELSSKNLLQPEKAQPFLQRISEEVQTSSQAMDDIIWSVNSRNDSLQETMARMRRYAAELFDNSAIDCHLQLDEKAGDKKLSMEQRRDVYLIYKEALNNIHKHADANNVWVDVAQNHNYLFIHIKDDGKGFNTSSVTHRNGLKNLRSRVEKWNGKIQIRSENEKGTSIEIKIPLKD